MPEIAKSDAETASTPRWFWLIFLALTIVVYLFGLTIPLVGPDEPRYAEVAREMFERGDWVTPTLGGFNWFEKPALLYWLEIGSYRIFGINEFAARFGSAACGVGTVASLWIAMRFAARGKENEPGSFSNWTAMIAATTVAIAAFAHAASFDIAVTFAITASLAGFIVFDTYHEKPSPLVKTLALASFYFFIGLALLAKGLIGAVFPFGIVGLYFVLSWHWPNRTFLLSLLWGIPLMLVVAATWYIPMYLQHGWQFIDEFIIQQHFQRFTSNKYQHPQPFYFFFWVLPLMTIPWLPFFALGIWKTVAEFFRGRFSSAASTDSDSVQSANLSFSPLLIFSISWILVPLLFFSFSGSKLPGYILPAVPGAVLLTSVHVYRFVQKTTFRRRLIEAIAIGTYVVMIVAILFVVPGFARKESVKDLIAAADRHGYAAAPVAALWTVSHNAEFYAAGRLIRDEDGKQRRFLGSHELQEYIDQHGGQPLVVLVPKDQITHLAGSDLLQTVVLDDNGELDVAIVSAK